MSFQVGMPNTVSSTTLWTFEPRIIATPKYPKVTTGKYLVWISLSTLFQADGCWESSRCSTACIRSSTTFDENAAKLAPNPTEAMSVDSKFGGIHVLPDGQSEHQEMKRISTGACGFVRMRGPYFASVVSTGWGSKPAAVSACT